MAIGFTSPVKAYAQVIVNVTHEIHLESGSEFLFEVLFYCGVFGKVY
jgi:hypothetical protein